MTAPHPSVVLVRPTSSVGAVVTWGDVVDVVAVDPEHTFTEIIAIARADDQGRVGATTPLTGVFGAIRCGDTLVITGGFPDGRLGAVTVSAAGSVTRYDVTTAEGVRGPIMPLCLEGRPAAVWRPDPAPCRVVATVLPTAELITLVDDPELIDAVTTSTATGPLVLVHRAAGLRAYNGGATAHVIADEPVDVSVVCGTTAGAVAAWSADHGRAVRLRHLAPDGRPMDDVADVAACRPGETVQSIHLACDGERVAVLWQTASDSRDPLPGDRTTTRFWAAVIQGRTVHPPVELPEGGPGAAAWRGDELVVVHGDGTLRITTLGGTR